MTDSNRKMENVRGEIVQLFATHDLTMPEAIATLAILLAQLAVFEDVPKDNVMLGMSVTFDEIHQKHQERKTCH